MSDYVRDLVPPGLPRVVLGLAGIIVLRRRHRHIPLAAPRQNQLVYGTRRRTRRFLHPADRVADTTAGRRDFLDLPRGYSL